MFNDRGARNIWVAAPPDYRGHALTSYPDGDGQEIGDLHWAPDGRSIVFVRGGGGGTRTITAWVPTYDPAKHAEAARLAFQSSPLAYVKDWRSPVLLIHGDDDRNVQFSQTVQLAAALRDQHVDVEQLIYPDDVHDFLAYAHWLTAYRAAAEFFARRLGGGR